MARHNLQANLTSPPAPAPGFCSIYFKTDNVLYIKDSSGVETALGSSSSITSLIGDVTGVGPGSATTTVAFVGGKTAAEIVQSVNDTQAATDANTFNVIVKRDPSGNFSATMITADLTGNVTGNVSGSSSAFTGSLSGDVTGTQSATSISDMIVTGKLLTGYISGSNTPILATDSILQAFEKTQGQLSATLSSAITNLIGDVVANGPGSVSATIQSNVVDNSKLAQMPSDTIKGNNTVSTANALDLTTAQVTAMLDVFVGDSGSGGFQGLVPAPAPGDTQAAKFLSADGSFETFPVSGELVSFFTGTVSDVAGYLAMTSTPPTGPEVYVTDSAPVTSAIIQSFATPQFNPGISFIPNGVVSINVHAYRTGGTKNVQLYTEIYKRDIFAVETLLATTNNSVLLTGIEVNLTSMNTIIPDTFLSPTDRIVVKIREFISGSGSNPTSVTIGFAGMTAARAGAPGTTVPAITSLSGDIVAVGPGNVVATIQPNVVDNTKLAQMPSDTLKGNNTGSLANASDLTIPEVVTMFGGTPVTQNTDQSNSAGTSNTFARGDHVHNIPTDVPVATGSANAQGSSAFFSKADHVHNVVTANGIQNISGTLSPVYGTPVTQTPDQTNTQGSSNQVSMSDHVHNIPSAAPVADLTPNTTNSRGVAATFSLSDHSHAIDSGTPVAQTPNQSNAAGSAASFAKSDHIHNIPTATPVNIGTSNNAGSAASFAASDHVHAISSSVVLSLLLTGYTIGSNVVIAATDSILIAFEKLQGQISALFASAMTSLTGDVTGTGPGATATTIAAGAVTDTKASLATKPAVTVVATTNQTLSGLPTIDGQATAIGSLILLTAQSTGSENGPWVAASGAWTRPTWYPSGGTTQAFQFITTFVRLGTTYQGSVWRQTAAVPIIIDTTATTWVVTPTSGNYKSPYIIGPQSGSSEVDLKFANANVGTLGWNPASSFSIVLPTTQGAAGTFPVNDGAGNLSWTNPLVNIDGGTANSVYTSGQLINGGSP